MNEQEAIALANLLAQLIPMGMQVYQQIQANHSGQVAPIETVLASADADWDAVAATAQSELNKQSKPGA